MTLKENQLFSSVAGRGAEIRLFPREEGGLKVGTIAAQAGAPTLLKGLLMAYDRSTDKWNPYVQPSDAAVHVLTANATPATAGTMLIIVDGLATEHAFDTTAVAAATKINAALLDAGKPYTVSGADTVAVDLGDANHVATFTFTENAGAPSWDVDMSGLTGNAPAESITDAGTQLNGTNEIRGVLYTMEGVVTHATNESQGVIMIEGELHRDDVNTTALRALMGGSPSEAEVDTALRSQKLRDLSLHVRGLSNVS
jgi:hypothetical protein